MSNSTQNDEIEVDGETYVKWDTQNDEVKQMEKAINEGFAESERDLKDKKTPLDQPTQNDWEKRYEEFITFVTNEKNWIDGRPVWKEYKYVTLANAIKYFIRKELADARREVIGEMIEALRKPIQWIVSNDTGVSSKTIWSVFMGVEPYYTDVPADEADYGRCVRLLQFIPEWQSRLGEVVEKYPRWKEAIDHILATLKEEGV